MFEFRLSGVKTMFHAEKKINERVTVKASRLTSFVFLDGEHKETFYFDDMDQKDVIRVLRWTLEDDYEGILSDDEIAVMADWFWENIER